MANPLRPSFKDLKNLVVASLIMAAAFAGLKQALNPVRILFFILFAGLTLFLREIGQRAVAHGIEADVETELSQEGSIVGILVSGFSYVSVFPLIFLAPVTSSYSSEKYENWGKSVDVLWEKRPYWIASVGIITLLVGWFAAFILNFLDLAGMISLFAFFQLLPLDEEKHVCGKLDGANIILWSGFSWLVLMSFTLAAMAFTFI